MMRKVLILTAYVLVFWVLLPGFLIAGGFLVDRIIPVPIPNSALITAIAIGTLVVGASLTAAAMAQLSFRGKGLPVSHLPPSEFVRGGLYRHFRHPIYLGYTIAFAGVSLLLHSFWALTCGTLLLVTGWIAYARFYEEPVLVRRFGDQYERYRAVTPILVKIRNSKSEKGLHS